MLARLTIPVRHLDAARTAAIDEVGDDTSALAAADCVEDRAASARILERSTGLLGPLLTATEAVELTAEHDQLCSPLVHLLEGIVRCEEDRFRAAAVYGPLPMGEILDVAERLRWAAGEAIRLSPDVGHRLTAAELARAFA